MRAFVLSGRGCSNARSPHRSRASSIAVIFSNTSGVTGTFSSFFNCFSETLRCRFDSSSGNPSIAEVPSRISKTWYFPECLAPRSLGLHPGRSDCATQVNFRRSKMAFVHCELQSCLPNALKSRSQVSDELVSHSDILEKFYAMVLFFDLS